jgi:hypothetical protein
VRLKTNRGCLTSARIFVSLSCGAVNLRFAGGRQMSRPPDAPDVNKDEGQSVYSFSSRIIASISFNISGTCEDILL